MSEEKLTISVHNKGVFPNLCCTRREEESLYSFLGITIDVLDPTNSAVGGRQCLTANCSNKPPPPVRVVQLVSR
ncbi:hypothetical protein J6590_033613 [Homalodisca vitripennis]|nr:hypothetical protein J6590_033613 [Homalodisca vitripennis]